ncbi:MAG: hypothetical protein QOK43_1418 [Acidimicrobiaceae bacterium]|nr:hypothetical protein [Acidimicrobiaceae bacterium]
MAATAIGPRLRAAATGPVFVLAVAGMVGFLLVSQLRGTQRFSQRLAAENEGDLARILAGLNTEADSLRDEIGTLKLQLLDLETSSRNDETAAKTADEQLQALQVLAGTVPVSGPGISLTVDDPAGNVGYDTVIDIVQELRDAGAEAVAVNNQRVGVASSFSEKDGKVALDGTPLTTTYHVTAIGPSETLEGGLKIPGGILDTLAALKDVLVDLQRSTRLDLPALARPPAFRVARPVSSNP